MTERETHAQHQQRLHAEKKEADAMAHPAVVERLQFYQRRMDSLLEAWLQSRRQVRELSRKVQKEMEAASRARDYARELRHRHDRELEDLGLRASPVYCCEEVVGFYVHGHVDDWTLIRASLNTASSEGWGAEFLEQVEDLHDWGSEATHCYLSTRGPSPQERAAGYDREWTFYEWSDEPKDGFTPVTYAELP